MRPVTRFFYAPVWRAYIVTDDLPAPDRRLDPIPGCTAGPWREWGPLADSRRRRWQRDLLFSRCVSFLWITNHNQESADEVNCLGHLCGMIPFWSSPVCHMTRKWLKTDCKEKEKENIFGRERKKERKLKGRVLAVGRVEGESLADGRRSKAGGKWKWGRPLDGT